MHSKHALLFHFLSNVTVHQHPSHAHLQLHAPLELRRRLLVLLGDVPAQHQPGRDGEAAALGRALQHGVAVRPQVAGVIVDELGRVVAVLVRAHPLLELVGPALVVVGDVALQMALAAEPLAAVLALRGHHADVVHDAHVLPQVLNVVGRVPAEVAAAVLAVDELVPQVEDVPRHRLVVVLVGVLDVHQHPRVAGGLEDALGARVGLVHQHQVAVRLREGLELSEEGL